jgi:hypothetical protein
MPAARRECRQVRAPITRGERGRRRRAGATTTTWALGIAVCVHCGAGARGTWPVREQAVLDALLAHEAGQARPAAVGAALAAVEAAQRSALADLPHGRFVFVRMNPAAGLGNRLVAMVSGLLLAAATQRGFLVGECTACAACRLLAAFDPPDPNVLCRKL